MSKFILPPLEIRKKEETQRTNVFHLVQQIKGSEDEKYIEIHYQQINVLINLLKDFQEDNKNE